MKLSENVRQSNVQWQMNASPKSGANAQWVCPYAAARLGPSGNLSCITNTQLTPNWIKHFCHSAATYSLNSHIYLQKNALVGIETFHRSRNQMSNGKDCRILETKRRGSILSLNEVGDASSEADQIVSLGREKARWEVPLARPAKCGKFTLR